MAKKELDMVGKKLSNERFVANAKPEVVQKNATNKLTTKPSMMRP